MLKIGVFSIRHLTQRTNYVTSNAIDHGSPALVAALGRDRVAAFGRQFRGLIPEVGLGRPAFLVRFGYAPAPSGRTGRLPLPAVTVRAAPPNLISQGRPE
jgi:hypothetical protein